MTLNNWKMIAETRSYIFRWRSHFRRRRACLSSLLSLTLGNSRSYAGCCNENVTVKWNLVGLSGLRLFYVGNVAQNRRSALSLAWHEWFSCKGKEWKVYCWRLALSPESQKLKFHVVIWQTTSKIAPKSVTHVQHDYFSLMQPIKSFICGVVVAVAVVIS